MTKVLGGGMMNKDYTILWYFAQSHGLLQCQNSISCPNHFQMHIVH